MAILREYMPAGYGWLYIVIPTLVLYSFLRYVPYKCKERSCNGGKRRIWNSELKHWGDLCSKCGHFDEEPTSTI